METHFHLTKSRPWTAIEQDNNPEARTSPEFVIIKRLAAGRREFLIKHLLHGWVNIKSADDFKIITRQQGLYTHTQQSQSHTNQKIKPHT
jgi:hypothetical protein